MMAAPPQPTRPPGQHKGFSGWPLWAFLAVQAGMAILTAVVVGQEAAQPDPFSQPLGALIVFVLIWIFVDAAYLGAWAAIKAIRKE